MIFRAEGAIDMLIILFLLLIHQAKCIKIHPNITDLYNEENSNYNHTVLPRQRGYGLVAFEDQSRPIHFDDERDHNYEDQASNKPLRFEEPNHGSPENYDNPYPALENQRPFFEGYDNQNPDNKEFDDQNPSPQSGNGAAFQDDNRIENFQQNLGQKKKKRRRRRRKPRQQFPGQGYGLSPGSAGQQGYGLAPGGVNQQGYGFAGPNPIPNPNFAPGPGGQFYRPPRRRRKMSIAEEAFSSVTRALTSIALYDDQQCVPRLLCEVAGGRTPATAGQGTLGSGVLQSIVNLQPLLTLLAAYNGVSASPLFVFGRAALLGMTSKGNAGTCRYAYPQCPTDPEQLVHYLNNHNGGFFRFFNGPQNQGQQNLEQFYNHLSNIPQGLGSNYGGQDPNGQSGFGFPQQPGQSYGLYPQHLNYGAPSQNQGYGFQNQPNLGAYGQKYGSSYPYQQNNGYGYQNQRYKNNEIDGNKIEKRIQNSPDVAYVNVGDHVDDAEGTDAKWSFPKETSSSIASDKKQRPGRTVKFPEKYYNEYENVPSYSDFVKKAKGFHFPENQSNRQYVDYYNYPPYTKIDNSKLKLNENGFYVNDNKDNNKNKEEGVEIVYVLRGNSDPNHPEVIKLRPGQKL